MHLDEAETELFKTWVIKKLEHISDADSDVLADYVLALVKTDEPEALAKANCIENLQDFLLDNSESFVTEVFTAIVTKTYLPNQHLSKPSGSFHVPTKRSSFEPPRQPNESRKRSFLDTDDDNVHGERNQAFEGANRPMKLPKKSVSRGGKSHPYYNPARQNGDSQLSQMPQMPIPPPGMPPFDLSNPLASLMAMQQAMGFVTGMPDATAPLHTNSIGQSRRMPRCKDYDSKGFCALGVSCPYEHGNNPFIVPQASIEYDPSDANNRALLNLTPNRTGRVDTSSNRRGRGGQVTRSHGGNNFRGGGKRSEFSHRGQNYDQSVTAVVVEQIPEDRFDEQSVRSFFGKFGNIGNIKLQPYKRLAVVEFDNYASAKAAYDSPKAVFDNRFVKVYWCNPEKFPKPPLNDESKIFHASRSEPTVVKQEEHSQIDIEQIEKRQEEAQRKHEEANKQREEAEKRKQELDEKLKVMDEERKQISDLLAKKTGVSTLSVNGESHSNGTEEKESTKVMRAQLAKLEAEAKSLGIDPDALNDYSGTGYSYSHRGRGGYRGGARGRGFYPSYRGGWQSGGGRVSAVKKLDNRPKSVSVTFPDGSYEDHEEALRQYLLFSGTEPTTLTKHHNRSNSAVVTFQERYQAESFMAAVGSSGLAHVGKVELAWHKLGETDVAPRDHNDEDSSMDAVDAPPMRENETRDMDTYDESDGGS